MKLRALLPSLALLVGLFIFTGATCPKIDPNADPVVVTTERLQGMSEASFDMIIKVDNADRGFWRTNAPAFHGFVEYLREKLPTVGVPGRTNLQRYLLVQWQLDQAKLQYKATKSAASSNALVAAQISLNALAQQTTAWLTIVTNRPPTTP